MPIFPRESKFRSFKGDKGHIEGPGEQREQQPQGLGQGAIHFFQICMQIHGNPNFIYHLFNYECDTCSSSYAIFSIGIRNIKNEHGSHAVLNLRLLFSLFTWTLDMTFVTLVTSKF